MPAPSFTPIAIVGVGSLFPSALNPTEFWQNIIQSRDFITNILPTHWLVEDYYDPNPEAVDKTYCKRAAFLPTIDFNPLEYGIPPNVLPAIDTAQLLALMVTKQVLEDAGLANYQELDLNRVSVILGSSTLEAIQYMSARLQRPVWSKVLKESGLPAVQIESICEKIANHYTPLQENTFPGLLQNVISGRVANRFNFGGTNCVTDAACASSLAALSMSIGELQSGTADLVVTGGVDTLNDIVMFMCFTKTKALSFSGDCRPFSDQADGTILGEGLAMFALKRLADAEQQGDRIYAVIRGMGTSSDGRSKSIYAPVSEGQAKALKRAYTAAGYSLSTVGLIEGHGTGTKAGDAAELAGLELAFKEAGEERRQICALGSVKSQIGHTKAAAGAAGLFKAVMALKHKTLPPTIKIEQPNAVLDIESSPLYLNTELRPWVHTEDHPRRAGVSSFGFGGSNYHVTLEEYQGPHQAGRLRTFATELLVLSAADPSQLQAAINDCLANISRQPSLSFLARKMQTQLNPAQTARLAIVAADLAEAEHKLQQALQHIQTTPEKKLALKSGLYYANQVQPGKVLFMFPGQGSQYLGMGGDLAMTFDPCIAIWDAANALSLDSYKTLADVVFPKPGFSPNYREACERNLTATEWAQPALAVSSMACLAVLTELGLKPDAVLGHSFGELTALYAAGTMDASTLIRLARKRGELMRDAAQSPGGMLCVFCSAAQAQTVLQAQQLKATLANFNAPNQIVLSGSLAEIDAAAAAFAAQNIRVQRLTVATGFHSHLVEASCQPLQKFLDDCVFQTPQLPVYANSTAQIYPEDPTAIKKLLAEQLAKPVRFQEQIEQAYRDGVRTFIEVGPQAVLSGLAARCLEQQDDVHVISLDRRGDQGLTALWHGLGQMFSIGLNPDFMALWAEYPPVAYEREASLNGAKEFTVKINGTNYAKPYPGLATQSEEVATSARPLPLAGEGKPVEEGREAQAETVQTLPPINHFQAAVTSGSESADNLRVNNHFDHFSTEETDMSHANNPQLMQIFQNLQLELVNSHNFYQKVMAESHIAFLNSISQIAQQAISGAGVDVSAVATPSLTAAVPELPRVAINTPAPVAVAPVVRPAPIAPAPVVMAQPAAPVARPVAAAVVAQAPVAVAPVAMAAVQPVAAQPLSNGSANGHDFNGSVAVKPATPVNNGSSNFNLEALLLEVVVDKTGYPAEMLNMDMAIEADLGIDSIKRVEILSTLAQRVPNLPEINPADLGKLQTLGNIMEYLQQQAKQ